MSGPLAAAKFRSQAVPGRRRSLCWLSEVTASVASTWQHDAMSQAKSLMFEAPEHPWTRGHDCLNLDGLDRNVPCVFYFSILGCIGGVRPSGWPTCGLSPNRRLRTGACTNMAGKRRQVDEDQALRGGSSGSKLTQHIALDLFTHLFIASAISVRGF